MQRSKGGDNGGAPQRLELAQARTVDQAAHHLGRGRHEKIRKQTKKKTPKKINNKYPNKYSLRNENIITHLARIKLNANARTDDAEQLVGRVVRRLDKVERGLGQRGALAPVERSDDLARLQRVAEGGGCEWQARKEHKRRENGKIKIKRK